MDRIIDFFKEETVYIFISFFILGITLFIVTRPFISKKAIKIFWLVLLFLIFALILHYNYRVYHIKKVAEAFKNGKNIICLDKTTKIGYVLIKKGEWRLENDKFINPKFIRDYNIRQCVVE